MTQNIFALSLLALFHASRAGSQGLKETVSMTTTTIASSAIRGTESATMTMQAMKMEGSETVDPFQDILFDPSLLAARVNRDVNDVSDGKLIRSTASKDAKVEESLNTLEDLDTQENKYYLEPNWYRRQDWKVEEERPTYKRESYNRFLKYPIFSGR